MVRVRPPPPARADGGVIPRSRLYVALALGFGVWLAAALAGESPLSPWHVAASGALALIALARAGELPEPTASGSRALFGLLLVWSAVSWALLGWVQAAGLGFRMFDIGIFGNLVARLALHGEYYSDVMRIHGLADHFSPSLMLLAPLFRLEPTVLWLYAANGVAVLASALILRRLCARVLGAEDPYGWLLPGLWLVHGVVTYAYLHQFQPSQLAPPLILAGFLFAVEGRTLPMVIALALLAGLKENMPLAVVSVGVFLWTGLGRRRLGAAVVLTASAYGLVIFFAVMPWLAEGRGITRLGIFDPFGLPAWKIGFPIALLASVGFLPLLRPRTLLFVLPVFAIHAVSGFDNMFSFRYHYTAMPMTVVFAAAVFGLRVLREAGGFAALAGSGPVWRIFVPCMAAALFALNGVTPFRAVRVRWPSADVRAAADRLGGVGRSITGHEVVYASDGAWPFLIDRRHLLRAHVSSLPRILAESRPHAVVVQTVEPTWTLPLDLAGLRRALDEAADAGRYERLDPGAGAVVYVHGAPR